MPSTDIDDLTFDVVLASASPRRRELLEHAGVVFTIRPTDVDETLEPDQLANPAEAVKILAQRKAHAAVEELLGSGYEGAVIVIGSDTMVALGNSVFGKPADSDEARIMLNALSGRTHQVHTGVSVWMVHAPAGEEDISLGFRTFVDTSDVTFRDIGAEELEAYIATDEPYDKAGGYAAQGAAGTFIEHVDGSLDTVIGLPVERLLHEFPDIKGGNR